MNARSLSGTLVVALGLSLFVSAVSHAAPALVTSRVALARVTGFRAVELRRVEKPIDNHRERFLEAWHEYFGR